jgi:hypothetical protein
MLFPGVPLLGALFSKAIYPPLRPFVGGIVFACHIFHRSDKIFRLRVPIIESSVVNIMTFTQDFVYWIYPRCRL